MCVSVYLSVYACLSMCGLWLCVYVYMCTHEVYLCLCVHSCVYVVYVSVCMCTCVVMKYIYVCVCMLVHVWFTCTSTCVAMKCIPALTAFFIQKQLWGLGTAAVGKVCAMLPLVVNLWKPREKNTQGGSVDL